MSQSVSQEQIIQCGIDRETAQFLLPQINRCLAADSAIAAWQQLTQHVLKPSHPFPLHQLLYETTFADWDGSQGSPPAWIPTAEQMEKTNIAALMRELNLPTYAELHQWSTRIPATENKIDRPSFWDVMIRRLGIRFQQPYTQLLDLSQGGEQPQWLVNARFNIVDSCFQAPDDAPAIVFQRSEGQIETWSYGKLHALANQVANSLVQLGIQPGAAIAIDMPMTPEAVAIYLGIIQAGCVVVSIADSFAAAEIATRLHIANAIAIFTQDSIQRCGKQIPLYARVVEADAPRAIVLSNAEGLDVELRSGDLAWTDFLHPNPVFTAVPMPPTAHINILFSSGTTGTPKAIPWNQTTPLKCAVDAHLHHDIHPGDVLAWFTNLGWMMGPWSIYASLINQATIALFDGAPTTREYGQFIQTTGVILLGVVPSLVSTWKTTACMQGLDWSTIKAFSSTGECSNPQDMLFLMSLAGYKPIIEYCGGTEIGGGYITGTLLQPCVPATFTTPALGLDFVILDADDRPTNKGEGYLIPPSIGLSTELLNQDHHQVYFANTPCLNQTPLRRHGDYLERLPNGYYRICGRVDDTMNLGGIKVSSAELERVLNTVDGIAETATIAFFPPDGGPSQLVVYAVTTPHTHATQAELLVRLQSAIAQHLNPLFKIRDVILVEALPRTASNKVMRRVLRDHYRAIAAAAKTITPVGNSPPLRALERSP
ncbi:MAG TPA: AMP-binding protein [Leptolyngbyaceae cyanobacterium M33_DOE_097]|uniref:AMP-dependent synthetase n=1 Tax=Oscillatoriales cyanobacterium SpSt-418 TaxID=2282169 RepID=A0A7C3KFK0_9CYAN|nr:AMP-binding protein [Leptolyngbyaceae cyanobacterium M33_DOE_097]